MSVSDPVSGRNRFDRVHNDRYLPGCRRLLPRLLGETLHDEGLLPAVGDLAAGGVDDSVGGGAELGSEREDVTGAGILQPGAHALRPDLDVDLRGAAGAVADVDLD